MSTPLHLSTLHGSQTLHVNTPGDPAGLADLLARHGLPLNTRCCKRGLCKGCAVRLETGAVRDSGTGQILAAPGEHLACRVDWIPGTEASLVIPSRSLLAHRPSVADEFRIRIPVGNDPLFPGEFGFAVDIGTTTVALILVELASGRIVARASDFNQQIRLGDDVLTRINLCSSQPEMLAQLQAAICRDTILPLACDACRKAGIAMERVGGMSVAANSTMLHLLFGIDPSPMGIAPFTPRFLERKVSSTSALGFCGIPDLPVHALPGLAAYVGADIAAGIFATGLHYESEPMLFVDVGTNGEIVLVKGDRLYACATAAGPAFEGSGLSHGMRATEGAVEAIAITRDSTGRIRLAVQTIGGGPSAQSPGICGSAYIDFLAQARSSGVLRENGRFDPTVVESNPELFCHTENGFAMRLNGGESPLSITEPDIALLLQAKAAIAAGIQTLLDLEGVQPSQVRKVFLAGGFGMHLNIPHAIACGLLPGFDPAQVETVGNTSLGGAYLALLDRTVLDELDRIRERTQIVELNLDPGFEDRYIDHLSLL